MAFNANSFTFQNLNTATEVLALKAEIAKAEYNGMSDGDIVRALVDRPLIANPEPAPKVPDSSKVNISSLLSKLTQAEIAAIPEDSLNRVGEHIKDLDIDELRFALDVWEAKGHIDSVKKSTLLGDVNSEVDDPNHRSQVPGSSKLDTAIGRQCGGLTINEVVNSRSFN